MTTLVRQTYTKTTLDSGIRIVTSEMPHTQSVSICLFVAAGSRNEIAEQSGISHFVEHVVFKGTKKRPGPKEISGTIEGVGGILNAETEHEYTCYWCKVPLSSFEESLDLLVDMLRNSVLDPEEVERERPVIIEELGMISDNPEYWVDVLINQMLWPDHPLGREVGGTRETIQSISRDMLIAYMDKQYRASNIVLSIAGNVKHEHVLKLAEKLMKGWPKGKSPAPRPFRDVQLVPQFKVEYRKTEQAHLSIGLPGLRMGHPDRYAFDLFSVALGEGMSSRLFLELRERLGLAYEVHSGSVHYRDCGAFFINAGVDPKKLADALAAVLDQVAEAKEGIPQEELDKARRLSSGRLMLRMEDTRAVSHWFGAQETLMDEIREAADIVKSLERVTTADLRRVSNDLLRPEQLNLAVVGRCRPSQRLEKALRF